MRIEVPAIGQWREARTRDRRRHGGLVMMRHDQIVGRAEDERGNRHACGQRRPVEGQQRADAFGPAKPFGRFALWGQPVGRGELSLGDQDVGG